MGGISRAETNEACGDFLSRIKRQLQDIHRYEGVVVHKYRDQFYAATSLMCSLLLPMHCRNSLHRSTLAAFPLLCLLLVQVIAAFLLSASLSGYRPKFLNLIVICFVRVIVILLCRLLYLLAVVLLLCWHLGLYRLSCAPSLLCKAWCLRLKI